MHKRMRRMTHRLRVPKGKRTFALVFLAALFASAISLRHAPPFESAEVKFADNSPSGLSIMPASCPSTPHWTGECDITPGCTISVNGASTMSYVAGNVSSITLSWKTGAPPSYTADHNVFSIKGTVTGVGTAFPSGSASITAPSVSTTYTYSGAYYDVNGAQLDTFSCSATVSVTNSTGGPVPVPQYDLYINQGKLWGNSAVSPGDHIRYRIYVTPIGNQTNMQVTAHIPDHTSLVWQGAGTSGNGVIGADVFWKQGSAPSGSSYYLDYEIQLNPDAPDGIPICTSSTVSSDQIVTPRNANSICTQVVKCPTSLGGAPGNPDGYGYKLNAYQASGERVTKNTSPICISNTSGHSFFLPANTSAEVESFKHNTPQGIFLTPVD